MENLPSSEAAQEGEQVAQGKQIAQEGGGQMSMQTKLGVPTTASMSVAKMKLLLQKRKLSSVNAPKPPVGKRRKSSGLNVNTLLRILSPRTGNSGGIGLNSPSMRGNGSLSLSAATNSLIAQDTSRSRTTKRRKLRSIVWKDFEPIYDGSLIVQAKCIHCLIGHICC